MITSASNAQVKEIKVLQKKSKAREQKNLFIVEGIRMVKETKPEKILAAYVSESFLKEQADFLKGWKVSYEVVEDKIFNSMCNTTTPQGILCLVKREAWTLEEILQKKNGKNPLIMVVETLQDPGNLGTIFRTGEAAGVSGIIMNRETVDIYNPKTVRSTMGAIYRMPFLYVDSLKDTIEILKENGIRVYAAHLKGEKSYDEFSYIEGTAFLIGNEGNGLTEETAALADDYLRIPMEGEVESLNAAVAAAVLMYEAHRQKK